MAIHFMLCLWISTVTQACSKQQRLAMSEDEVIDTNSNLGMGVQIRVKQLAIRGSQDKQKNIITQYINEQHDDETHQTFTNKLLEKVKIYVSISQKIKECIKNVSVGEIGYPIKFNKTAVQLEKLSAWLEQQKCAGDLDRLIGRIMQGFFYKKLRNDIDSDALPILGVSIEQAFYGNEVSSVSSMLLATLATMCGKEPISMPGAATFYPFLKSTFKLPIELVDEIHQYSYPFASEKGMFLFGDYQYGGHRDLPDQFLFAAEECSTSVAKAINLSFKDKSGIGRELDTAIMVESFYNKELQNKFGYQAIDYLSSERETSENQKAWEAIEPGDIFLVEGHTATFETKYNNSGITSTFQFGREIEDAKVDNRLGGGTYSYNLFTKIKDKTVYILRPNKNKLSESISLTNLLHTIDQKYGNKWPNGPADNVIITWQEFFGGR
ncbi:RP439 family protein [Candidatus Cardinium hertigii]|nr:hypothetical protein [Candidatus Cardinium hertigii]